MYCHLQTTRHGFSLAVVPDIEPQRKRQCLTPKSETATIFINTDFCTCALPVSIDSVVMCNGCKRAFHKSCLGRRYDGLEFKCWKCAGKTTPLIITLPAAYNSHLRPL